MAAIVIAGEIVYRTQGCAEGAGQDYYRLEGANGVVEAHPAFNTTSDSLSRRAAVITIDNVPLSGAFLLRYDGLIVSRINVGAVHRDIICAAAGSAIVIHVPVAQPVTWVAGNSLNVGVSLV